uniref:Uncharacterized protein n=1 Tax=Ciona intestinalis TaxID=7719 RepID=H2XMR0_CIOIN
MASNSIFKNFRESLNSWLINVAGVSLTDISNKDPFSNKFNIFLFASLMAMLTAFLTLFVIGKFQLVRLYMVHLFNYLPFQLVLTNVASLHKTRNVLKNKRKERRP